MAVLSAALQRSAFSIHHRTESIPIFGPATKLELRNSTSSQNLAKAIRYIRNSNRGGSARYESALYARQQNQEDFCDAGNEIVCDSRGVVQFICDIFPVGRWWQLSAFEQKVGGSAIGAEPMTVLKALSQMWALVADEKWILFTAVVTLCVAALAEISIPRILTAAIFAAQNGEMLVFFQNTRLLILLCFTSGVCSGLRSGCFAIANTILVKHLRATLYSSLLFQPLLYFLWDGRGVRHAPLTMDISFFDAETVGDLTSRITADCQRISRTIGYDLYLVPHWLQLLILQGVGAFINLMTLSRPLALSSLVICFILSAIFLIYGLYQKKAALLAQNFVASANEVVQETFSLMRTVRAYGTEREESQRFSQWLDGLASVGLRESLAYGFWSLSFHSLYRLTQVCAVLLGGMSILAGTLSAEQLTKYILYCEWLIYATWRLQDSMSSLFQSVGASEKVFQLMLLPPSYQFLPKRIKVQSLTGCIDFVNVSFRYPTRDKMPILENLNFSINANEVVAIVGPDGSGKSTLINLLLRLYEPSCGEILIDNIPLGEMDIRWLREQIGFVGQEPHLFQMDVKSNISYGCIRSIGLKEIEFAAKNACAHEFISALPRGYETVVDDNLLSGGQKQRIAIARALLRNPAIIVLDEATSALDAETEGYVQEIVYNLKKDTESRRTVIVVSHRLSTVKAADRILVMNKGHVVEIGSHQELLSKGGGLYAQLFKFHAEEGVVEE